MLLVVAAWVERTLIVFRVYVVLVRHPPRHSVVYDVGRVAVVCCFLGLELGKPFLVFLVIRQIFTCGHALGKLPTLALDFIFFALLDHVPPVGNINAPVVEGVTIPSVG